MHSSNLVFSVMITLTNYSLSQLPSLSALQLFLSATWIYPIVFFCVIHFFGKFFLSSLNYHILSLSHWYMCICIHLEYTFVWYVNIYVHMYIHIYKISLSSFYSAAKPFHWVFFISLPNSFWYLIVLFFHSDYMHSYMCIID